jgi:crotonobetainyl-CoA:carnitine CoA-transferase CaiB-like acyl-CoA transferase
MTLGDLGADVVKVESPHGDDTRQWGPPFDDCGRSTYFNAANRNKESLVLDLSDGHDRDIARRLCDGADVVVSNFRVGTLQRFMLDYDAVSGSNPGVVYCEVSGFGEGKGRDLPGYDPLVQALGGLMSITGPPDTPSKTGVAIVDIVAGLYASTAVLAALYERERSGCGQRVTVNLLHAALATLANQATGYLGAGDVPRRLGNDHPSIEPFSTYRTGEGDLMICAGNDRQFRALLSAIGADVDDERFADNASRVRNRRELREVLEEYLQKKAAREWAALLLDVGVPAGPVLAVDEAFSLAADLELEVVDECDGVRTVAYPATLSRTPARTNRRPPALDEHREFVPVQRDGGPTPNALWERGP